MRTHRFPVPVGVVVLALALLGPAGVVGQEASPAIDPAAAKEVARDFIAAFAAPDPAAMDELLAPDFVNHAAPPGLPPTREGMVQLAMAFEAGVPDYQVAVEDQVAEGDLVATRATASGTQTGAFLGIPPTGRPFAVPAIFVDRVVGGQIAEHWELYDQLGVLTQVGVVPGGAAAPATPISATPASTPTSAGSADLEANTAVALRFIEAIDTGNPAILDEVFAPDFVYRTAGPGEPTGVEGQKGLVAAFAGGFPDSRVTIEEVVAEGNTVVLRWTFSSTHQGAFFGIPPTGRPVTIQGVDWYHIEGGRITEYWDVIDELGLLTQLGVLPGLEATPTAATPGA